MFIIMWRRRFATLTFSCPPVCFSAPDTRHTDKASREHMIVTRASKTGVLGGLRRFLTIPARIPEKGLVNLNGNSRFLQVSGADAALFINGLTTIKLLPKHLKKNQTTISEADVNNENIVRSISLSQELIASSNWGILHEAEEYDPKDENELPLRLGVRRDGRFGHILKANGRVFSDVFIYPSPLVPHRDAGGPNYLIEVLNKAQFKPLQAVLKLHKLRSKVEIQEVNLDSWFYYNDTEKGSEIYDLLLDNYFSNGNSKDPDSALHLARSFLQSGILFHPQVDPGSILGLAIDQRSDYFGVRIVTAKGEQPAINDLDSGISVLPYEDYCSRRIEYGIVETADFQNTSALPFECNLDWMHGINYDKGCYMGQELTIRTWTGNGTVRRVLPVKFDTPITDIADAYERLELRVVDGDDGQQDASNTPANGAPVYNPFGSSVNAPVRSRRDAGKVGEVLINNGVEGLARIEKKYFNWDEQVIKKVKVIHNGTSYTGTIDTSLWN